jgi:protease-4
MTARDGIHGIALAIAAATLASGAATASDSVTDFARRDLLPASPSVTGGAVGGLVNPAAWSTVAGGELAFWWNDDTVVQHSLDNWGLSAGGQLGFSVERRTVPAESGRLRVYDYQVGFAAGNRIAHTGVAWRWSTGDDDALGRDNGLVLGSIARPNRFMSYGLSGLLSAERSHAVGVADLGIRPLGRPELTVFGDYSLTSKQRIGDGEWSAGVEIRPAGGVHLGARVQERSGTDELEYVVNLGLTIDRLGLHILPGYDDGGDRGTTTYLVRGNPPYRGLPFETWLRKRSGHKRWETIDLEKRTLTYQRGRWFDKKRVAWIDVCHQLERLRRDAGVGGVVVRLSESRIRPSLLWELRQELVACQEAGLEVAVHLDRARMGGYWLASAADHVVMEPRGDLEIVGLAAQRTYMKGLLEKLGIGFEEHRYFRYKSAAETFTRTDMSEADREQIGRQVDVIYETLRAEICESRGISEAAFETIVEERAIIFAEEAKERGLVDALGRWEDVRKWVKERGGSLANREPEGPHYDERWGKPPVVALVYADGASEMDKGFQGRGMSRHLEKLAKRRDVAAVVMRADSPGGDPLPAELVADGVVELRGKGKPVVITQGDVAASGGYRICTDADRMYTTPLTVTGSIGVISAWVWDDGLGGKTGFSADGIQRGSHADLFSGIRFPLIGLRLPTRNLDEGEKERMREGTMELYDGFVASVARGRNLPEERVRELAEGRVWMGGDAVERGLCDEIGTLPDALARARELAGLEPDEEILIEEYPPRPRFGLSTARLLRMSSFVEPLVGDEVEREEYAWRYVRMLADRPGAPMLLVPPEAIPDGWMDW